MKADWTACSPRRIQLRFQEAGASRLRISDALEALIAPALLPRTWLTQQALLALREVGSSAERRRERLSQPVSCSVQGLASQACFWSCSPHACCRVLPRPCCSSQCGIAFRPVTVICACCSSNSGSSCVRRAAPRRHSGRALAATTSSRTLIRTCSLAARLGQEGCSSSNGHQMTKSHPSSKAGEWLQSCRLVCGAAVAVSEQ